MGTMGMKFNVWSYTWIQRSYEALISWCKNELKCRVKKVDPITEINDNKP